MRALAILDDFGIENLRWRDLPDPVAGLGEAVVRLTAAAFNFRDLQVIAGARAVPRPLVPLSDGCGVITGLGPGVTRWAIGDRVMPVFAQGWLSGPLPPADSLPTLGGPLDGTLREAAAWHAENLVAVPDGLSDIEAATLPCAAVSAWNALFVATHTQPGDTVLIQGTGGVALFALQFAHLAGARTVLISSSDDKLARAASLGADIGINYLRQPDWGEEVRRQAGPVDCVIEVGGSGTLEQSLICLRNGGHVSVVGFLSGSKPSCDLGELSRKAIRVQGIRVGNRDSFEAMCRAIAQSRLKPVIDQTFAFNDAQAALRTFRDTSHFGKLCLSLTSQGPTP